MRVTGCYCFNGCCFGVLFQFGCGVCGGTGCSRHLDNTDPWDSLLIHKQLDQAVEDVRQLKYINTSLIPNLVLHTSLI